MGEYKYVDKRKNNSAKITNKNIEKTDMGWVDLSNLVNYPYHINWDKSIGKIVPFQYNEICAELIISERDDNVQYVYIDIPGYVEHYKIYVGQIRHGQLGGALKKITNDFRHSVGDIVNDLLITGMYREPGYKYYNYKCIKDGYEGVIREDHLEKGHGCPVCNNSIGEKCVIQYLKKHKIKFLPQYSFDNCRYKEKLYFDFYLPNYNACIEYDGIQHFEPVDFAGKGEEWAKEQFKYTILRDNIKNNYCKNNGMQLCRIKYTQDIKETLDSFFNVLLNI